MRCVVVGGMGFLGTAVVHTLLGRGDEVRVLDPHHSQTDADARFGPTRTTLHRGNILDPASLERAFAGADEVYHFAGVLGTSELDDDIRGAVAGNITGAVNVFEAAVGASVRTLLYPSKPNVWRNAYTITKAASEELARLYTSTRDIDIRSLRYFNAYGPGQATGPVRKIIPTFTLQALRGEPLTIYGDGEQTVDMIHADDIGAISVAFMRAAVANEVVDCGRGIAMTVNEVADAVNAIVGNEAGRTQLPMRRGETPGTTLVADIGPLRSVIGDYQFQNWEQSLRETIASYAERFPNGALAARAGTT